LVLGNYYRRTGDTKTTHRDLLVKYIASCHTACPYKASLRMRAYSDLHHCLKGLLTDKFEHAHRPTSSALKRILKVIGWEGEGSGYGLVA
jgi:hypothetical protein